MSTEWKPILMNNKFDKKYLKIFLKNQSIFGLILLTFILTSNSIDVYMKW